MKKISNKLFQDLKLENSEIVKVVGGIGTSTSTGEDTGLSNGQYDISFQTLDSTGANSAIDYTPTGNTEKDKPGTCKLQNYFIQG